MELDWRNRCVGGERLEDLCAVVYELEAVDDEQLFDQLWDDPHTALPFHRALLRIGAELLWQRAGPCGPIGRCKRRTGGFRRSPRSWRPRLGSRATPHASGEARRRGLG